MAHRGYCFMRSAGWARGSFVGNVLAEWTLHFKTRDKDQFKNGSLNPDLHR
jgi:hypothetical protein